MLLICVLDDDGASGECIRVRGECFVVGRTEGDYCVPHEAGMSGRHLEFVREKEEGEYFWTVRDLETSNGTFAHVEAARLRQGQEIVLGSRRYRLDAAPQGAGAASEGTGEGPRKATQAWHVIAAAEGTAALVRLKPEGEGERYPLETEEQWVGTDGRACRIAIQDDHFLDPRHAKLYRKGRQWWIEDGGSVNGTWVAIKRIRIDSSAEIQVGEQRFKIRVP
jgi:pSer/pThr/pTyr-binding forkhead associated (FHA) protein